MNARIWGPFFTAALSAVSLLGLVSGSDRAEAAIIPDSRRIAWDPGVRGGIPARTTIFVNVKNSPYNAKGDGITDDSTAILNAISACPAGQVVYLPAGTYLISSAIRVKSGITVRGAGMGVTVVKGRSGYSPNWLMGFEVSGYDWDYSMSPSRNLASGHTKGSTNLTTSVAHGWSVGDTLLIDQLADPTGDPPITADGSSGMCTWCSRANGTRPVGQWVQVRSVPSTTSITFDPPLYINYNATKSPQGYKVTTLTSMAGIEDLTIDNSLSGAWDTVYMHHAVNCWLSGVEMNGSYRRMVDTFGGLWNTIRGCVLHNGVPATPTIGSHYGPNRAYGIFINQQSACLIEDNQFYALSLMVSLEGAPAGNVIAYNFFKNSYYNDVEWGRLTIGMHGAHPMMNLIEGNHAEDKFDADFYWGSSSHQTFFRNRMFNQPGKLYGSWGFDIYMKAHYYNIVGNVLGTIGYENKYELTGDFNYSGDRSIYRLGYESAGDSDATGNDAGVASTLLRHGNWDSVRQTTTWDPAIADHALPASLYLASKPAWWGGLPWPAIGPDVTPMGGDIPAKIRYEGGQIPSGDPSLSFSPSELTFSVVSGATSAASQTFAIANGGTASSLAWAQTDNAAWLTATPASGSTPGTVTVSVNPTGLAVGTYTGLVTVTSASASNSPQRATIRLTVTPPPSPALSVSPGILAFSASPGGAPPPSQAVSIANSGTASVLSWSQSDDAAWLTASASSGVTPATIAFTANPAGLAVGVYTGRVTVASAGVANSPQLITAILTIASGPQLLGRFDMTYTSRDNLLAAGWDYLARTASGTVRNTEQTAGLKVSYDQSLHPGCLRIPADTGDLWANYYNDTRNSLFRDLPDSWTSVRMRLAAFNPTESSQQAGLGVYQDDDNYVLVYRIYEGANYVGLIHEAQQAPSVVQFNPQSASVNLYFRIDREPDSQNMTGYYGLDGVNWTSLGSVSRALNNPRLAIVVGASPGGTPNADVAWVEVYGIPTVEMHTPSPPRNLRQAP